MASKEISFSLEITLNAFLTHQDGTTEDVEDTKSIVDIFKEVPLVENYFKKETYFRLQKVSDGSDGVVLTSYVFSEGELEALDKSVNGGYLARKLTDFACQQGLEAELGLQPGSNKVQLEFELENLSRKSLRQGITFFKSNRNQETVLASKQQTVILIPDDDETKSDRKEAKSSVKIKGEKVTHGNTLKDKVGKQLPAKVIQSKSQTMSNKGQQNLDFKDNGNTGKRKNVFHSTEDDISTSIKNVHDNKTEQGQSQLDGTDISYNPSLSGADWKEDQLGLTKKQQVDEVSSAGRYNSREHKELGKRNVLGIKENLPYHESQEESEKTFQGPEGNVSSTWTDAHHSEAVVVLTTRYTFWIVFFKVGQRTN